MNKYILTEEELLSLLTDSIKLNCLDGAGVDNWGGYGEAFEIIEEEGFNSYEDCAEDSLSGYELQ